MMWWRNRYFSWVDVGGCRVDVKVTSTHTYHITNQYLNSVLGGCWMFFKHKTIIFIFQSITMARIIPTKEEVINRLAAKPANYPICMNTECRNRNTCLHALETTEQKMQAAVITCINPRMYADGTECTQYRPSGSTCHYAFGMRTLAERLKSEGRYRLFMNECLKHFCRTVYYDMYAGMRVISPEEQDCIVECARAVGTDVPSHPFDEYAEVPLW